MKTSLCRAGFAGGLLAAGMVVVAAAAAGEGLPNPFYAMDTVTQQPYPKGAMPVAEQLDLLKELGYAGTAWTADDPARVKEAAELCSARGLKMFSIYVGAPLTKAGLQPDARIDGIIDALKGHGTIVWLHITSKDFPSSSPEGDAAALDGLRRIADRAATNGLKVAIYPHRGDWTERVQDAVRVAREVDRPNFGVTFNLCHCLMAGDEARIPELLAEAAPHLFIVSLNGADKDAANTTWQRLIRPLDEGTYDPVPLLRTLRELGYQGPIGLQGYGVKIPARENLTRSMAAWRKYSAAAAAP